MQDKIKITYKGKEYEYDSDVRFIDIANDLKDEYEDDILLASFNGKLKELFKKVKKDGAVEFFTARSPIGQQTYRRSVTFLMVKSIFDAMGHDKVDEVRILHSIDSGSFCRAKGDFKVDEEFITKVRAKMTELCEKKLPIKKETVSIEKALSEFKKYNMLDKEKLFHYRTSSYVNLYKIENFEDYYYGFMVPDTSYLKYFDLFLYDDGFIIQFPTLKDPKAVPEFTPYEKLFATRKEAVKWADMQGIRTVGDLNEKVVNKEINDIILVQEALQEKKIADIAKQIYDLEEVKFVLIAGPSSSGKTSFSHRLSIQLRTLGLNPHPIACDNYFVERDDTPKDEDGNFDFECLEAVDTKLLNEQLDALLKGEEVSLPTFDFEQGKKIYKGNTLKLGEKDILVLEGIHCLNDKLTYQLDRKNKFKIYISALTQLNIDEHNRIPSTDGRLIRRMIRDARTRGASAAKTISMWPSVRRGEENHIFPYQEDADAMFNSAAIYELAVFKQYCESLLFSVPQGTDEYLEAKRLLKFFSYFVGVSPDSVPNNSLIKEFIGGSIFPVG